MNVSYAQRMEGVRPSAIRDLLRYGADPELISFGGGYPDPALFPMAELASVFDELLAGDPSVLQYSASDGLFSLRAHVASRLSQSGTFSRPEDVLILHGAQQGLDLVAKLLIDPGDTIVVEHPTFIGAMVAFNPFQPTYASVRIDDDGMDMEDLERVLTQNPRTKLIYTVPDFQNPTGVTLSLQRRKRLIELANEFDIVVLEDSPYRELRYSGAPIPTLKSLDAEGRVIHVGSFSKILAPGMRLAWAIAAPELLSRLTLLKMASDTQSSTLNMAAASKFLDRFDIDLHIETQRKSYEQKRDLMLATIESAFPDNVAFTRPDGGLFTWLSWPDGFDSAVFLREKAIPLAKATFVPGVGFFATAPRNNHARINFSGVTDEQITAGIGRLGTLLQ